MADPTQKKPDPKPALPNPHAREERAKDELLEVPDFAKLDLRVETVEERISPSETNVFDK
ncbi:MAG: hypothetical protein ACK57N_02090 [Planctomycetia bacterium]|jgi:hypothetical protein